MNDPQQTVDLLVRSAEFLGKLQEQNRIVAIVENFFAKNGDYRLVSTALVQEIKRG